jgi:hypothetical protein
MILIIDTRDPEGDHAYFQELYEKYRAVSPQTRPLKLRVLLILLNKFDLWGRTAEARETMISRYRNEVFRDLVNGFRSSLGVTVQWGYRRSRSLSMPPTITSF